MKSVLHWSIIKFRSTWIYCVVIYIEYYFKKFENSFWNMFKFLRKTSKISDFYDFLCKMFIFDHLSLSNIFLYKNKDKSHLMSLDYLVKMINFCLPNLKIFIYLIFSCIFKKNVKNIWFLWFFFIKFIFNNLNSVTFYILGRIFSSLQWNLFSIEA